MASISLIFYIFILLILPESIVRIQRKKARKAFSSAAYSFLFVRQQIFHALALRRGGLLIGIAKTDNVTT